MKIHIKKGDFVLDTELRANSFVETFEMLLKVLDKVKEIVT